MENLVTYSALLIMFFSALYLIISICLKLNLRKKPVQEVHRLDLYIHQIGLKYFLSDSKDGPFNGSIQCDFWIKEHAIYKSHEVAKQHAKNKGYKCINLHINYVKHD